MKKQLDILRLLNGSMFVISAIIFIITAITIPEAVSLLIVSGFAATTNLIVFYKKEETKL